jgi:hypothetical protein
MRHKYLKLPFIINLIIVVLLFIGSTVANSSVEKEGDTANELGLFVFLVLFIVCLVPTFILFMIGLARD